MREVTLFWRRERLALSDIAGLADIFESMIFLGYMERSPKTIRILVRVRYAVGYGPVDIDEVPHYEHEGLLSDERVISDDQIIVLRVTHPLSLLAARIGKLTVKPGSRLDAEGLSYIVRGSPVSIRIIVTAARLMLRPDRISASGLTMDDIDPDALSKRQFEVLQIAHAMGWYQVPRACTLSDIAKQLSLGRSTVSEHLVRAESEVIGTFLKGEPVWLGEEE